MTRFALQAHTFRRCMCLPCTQAVTVLQLCSSGHPLHTCITLGTSHFGQPQAVADVRTLNYLYWDRVGGNAFFAAVAASYLACDERASAHTLNAPMASLLASPVVNFVFAWQRSSPFAASSAAWAAHQIDRPIGAHGREVATAGTADAAALQITTQNCFSGQLCTRSHFLCHRLLRSRGVDDVCTLLKQWSGCCSLLRCCQQELSF